MRISSIGVGSPFCSYPFFPESYMVRADEEIIMINCPAKALDAVHSYGKTILDIDIFLITDTSLSSICGLERVALRAQEEGVKPMIVAPSSICEALTYSFAPALKGPLKNYFDINSCRGVEVKEVDGYKEKIKFIPHTKVEKCRSYGLHFQESDVLIAGKGMLDPKWIDFHSEGCKVVSCNLEMERRDWSDAFDIFLQSSPQLIKKCVFTGFKDKYLFNSVKKLPLTFLEQNECIYDSKKNQWITHKKAHSKRTVGSGNLTNTNLTTLAF